MEMTKKIGVLLINLGTPNSYQKKDVRTYLRQFLWDKRVIDIPWLFRILLLYCIILPFRTKKSAKAYRSIWMRKGSPLAVYHQALARHVQQALPSNYVVQGAMRYQSPSIEKSLAALMDQGVNHLVVFPLFPQCSSAASGSALEEVYSKISAQWNVLPVTTVPSFYAHPVFIESFERRIQNGLSSFNADYVLFSYHGLPERHIFKSENGQNKTCLISKECCHTITKHNEFCYRAHCFATTRALAEKLNFPPDFYSSSFQSRLGRTKWIEPYTDLVLPQLAQQGFKRLLIVCPSFVADCLETLEEIAIRAKSDWLALGGEDLQLVPSLNAEPDWVQGVVHLIKEQVDVC